MERKRRQAPARPSQAAQTGRDSGSRPEKRLWRTMSFNSPMLTRLPQRVLSVWLMTNAKPPRTKKTARRATRATGFHLTQAEMARVRSESMRIHSQEAAKIAQAIPKWLLIQLGSSETWKRKSRRPGTQ